MTAIMFSCAQHGSMFFAPGESQTPKTVMIKHCYPIISQLTLLNIAQPVLDVEGQLNPSYSASFFDDPLFLSNHQRGLSCFVSS